MAFDADVP